jgi:hypothetical protein
VTKLRFSIAPAECKKYPFYKCGCYCYPDTNSSLPRWRGCWTNACQKKRRLKPQAYFHCIRLGVESWTYIVSVTEMSYLAMRELACDSYMQDTLFCSGAVLSSDIGRGWELEMSFWPYRVVPLTGMDTAGLSLLKRELWWADWGRCSVRFVRPAIFVEWASSKRAGGLSK